MVMVGETVRTGATPQCDMCEDVEDVPRMAVRSSPAGYSLAYMCPDCRAVLTRESEYYDSFLELTTAWATGAVRWR